MSIDATSTRYARQRTLSGFGVAGQQSLASARVLVVGAGGLGSAVLPTLAAAGVGHVVIVDGDRVDESNLHRQTLYSIGDVGRLKAEAAADVVRRLSPEAEVAAHAVRFDADTAEQLSAGVDLLVDAGDNTPTRYLANDMAALRDVPLVWGNALGWAGQLGVAWSSRGSDYRDLFPTEPAEEGDSCATVGVLPSVCTTIGGMMAGEVLKILTGSGDPLVGRVVYFDARSGRSRELRFRRGPEQPESRPLASGPAPHGIPSADGGLRILDPLDLKRRLDDGARVVLLDVREPWEAERARIPGSTLLPLHELPARLGELDRAAPTIVYCHHGPRAMSAVEYLEQHGFAELGVLRGGIDAWAREVDPSVQRY